MVANQGQLIQAMELLEGKVNLNTGTHSVKTLVHCVEDGSITVTWQSGNTDTVDMVAGQDYALNDVEINISSGKYHIN